MWTSGYVSQITDERILWLYLNHLMQKMWKLKIADGTGPWLTTTNNHIGRQHWEFDPEAGTPDERVEVERLREEFKKNRSRTKQSADLLMRMQVIKHSVHHI